MYDPLYTVQFIDKELRAAVQAASDYGTYVATHVYNVTGIHRAVAAFRNTHAVRPIGADICHFADDVAIVRVIFSTSKRPPDRAWFEVTPLGAVREIEYEDVAVVEQPLR